MVPREFQARVYLAEVDKLSANNLRINMTKGIKKALVLSLAGLLVFSFAVLPVIADAGMRDGWRDRDWRDGRRDRDWGGHFDGRFGRGGFGNRLGNIGELFVLDRLFNPYPTYGGQFGGYYPYSPYGNLGNLLVLNQLFRGRVW